MLGFVFPGQGSQSVGMLGDLADEFLVFGEYYQRASDSLGFDVGELVAHDNDNRLSQTAYTQPAILTVSCALWQIWLQQGGQMPQALAGHSLGEYSALVAAGSIDFEDAVKLVHLRGKLMQNAVPEGQGMMLVILGLSDQSVQQVCADTCAQLNDSEAASPANYNANGQVVVAGKTIAREPFTEIARAAGAKKVMPVQMSVPSHCQLMNEASEKLAEAMCRITIRDAAVAVIQNVDAQPHTRAQEIQANLVSQLCNPVLWTNSVARLVDTGITTLVECGPGKVLQGLIKRINKDIAVHGLMDAVSFRNSLATFTHHQHEH